MPVTVRLLSSVDNAAALELWEDSVRATHHFVADEHIRQYREMVRQVLEQRPLDVYGLYDENKGPAGAREKGERGRVLAIMGVEPDGAMMGMLFVATAYRGRGYGTLLLRYALALGVCKVDVNEQNVEARAFYERKGFVARGRAPVDGVGNPYPLIHMTRE